MSILIPVIAVTVIGLICAVMLVVASKFMAVKEDETFINIRNCLPGANCGACGYAGCDGYAHALADGTAAATNLCVPGADACAKEIAGILGVEAQDVVEQVAYVACCGDSSCTTRQYQYEGIQTCQAANMLFAGDGVCNFTCLGYGDCAAVCPNDAICIEDGLAHVKPSLCVGCGLCAKHCPNHLIHIVPDTVRTVVRCSNHDKGAVTRKACTKGCIGCKKCERECPVQAITVVDNCAQIDYSKCTNCGHCVEICTTGCITEANFTSLHNQPKEAAEN
ncbi:MAG: RnfABCDGE type electron transport complex subunit B [Oscillospiraceae bacterium]|nr:RnfABCDGE type electron transport complex subunit B [Oscillospiraceae bacterium]